MRFADLILEQFKNRKTAIGSEPATVAKAILESAEKPKPSNTSTNRRFSFVNLDAPDRPVAQAKAIKPAASSPLKISARQFEHLRDIGGPAVQIPAAPQAATPRLKAPTKTDIASARATLAMTGGSIAVWVEKPTGEQLKAAQAVVERQRQADVEARSKTAAAAKSKAAEILAAGNFRGVLRPA